MNPKIFVGVAVAALAGIIGVVAFSGQTIISDISDEGFLDTSAPPEILPLEIELEDIEISQITEKAAFLDVKFKITNPNQKSMILKQIKYELYENDEKIHLSVIGERPEGGVVMGTNYFTVLSGVSIKISDEVVLKNTGNTPELWNALTNNSPSWKIKGEAYAHLSSMTSGGENEIPFEFTK